MRLSVSVHNNNILRVCLYTCMCARVHDVCVLKTEATEGQRYLCIQGTFWTPHKSSPHA